MTRRTQLVSLLSAGGAMLLGGLAHAQSPSGTSPGDSRGSSSMGSGGAAGGSAGTSVDAGAVSNTQSTTTTSTSTTGPDDTVKAVPNTGGEPLLMALLGSCTAGSALLLRRKLR